MDGVELVQLRARERAALAIEGVDALAQRAQPGDARVRRSRFGARRRVLLYRFAGVAEGERELAVVGAAGGWELFDREVLVVALEHPPARPCEQLVTARGLVRVVRGRGRRARARAGRRGSAAAWIRGRARARCSSTQR